MQQRCAKNYEYNEVTHTQAMEWHHWSASCERSRSQPFLNHLHSYQKNMNTTRSVGSWNWVSELMSKLCEKIYGAVHSALSTRAKTKIITTAGSREYSWARSCMYIGALWSKLVGDEEGIYTLKSRTVPSLEPKGQISLMRCWLMTSNTVNTSCFRVILEILTYENPKDTVIGKAQNRATACQWQRSVIWGLQLSLTYTKRKFEMIFRIIKPGVPEEAAPGSDSTD